MQMRLQTSHEQVVGDFACNTIVCDRRLAKPTDWEFSIRLSTGTNTLDRITEAIDGGTRWVQPVWHGGLGPECRVMGAVLHRSLDVLLVRATSTVLKESVEANGPDVLTTRRRVLRASNLNSLLKSFSALVEVDKDVQNHLANQGFSSADKACFIQDGLSDLAYLEAIIDNYVSDRKSRLVLTANAPGSSVPYRLAWTDLESCGTNAVELSSFDTPRCSLSRILSVLPRGSFADGYPAVDIPTCGEERKFFSFDAEQWSKWYCGVLPLVNARKQFIWRVRDVLSEENNSATIFWSTQIEWLTAPLPLSTPFPAKRNTTWVGVGTVTRSSSGEPWLEIKLGGFENPDHSENTVWGRLLTPSSGQRGKTGLHLVPAEGTSVAVVWSGNLDAPILALGNVRSEATEFAHSFLKIDDKLLLDCQELAVGSSGNICLEGSGDAKLTGQNITLTARTGSSLKIDRTSVSIT